MLIVAIWLWCAGVHPVIFRQIRSGKDGKPFTIYKFRSMTNERDAEGNLLPDEKRLTRVGAFLRKMSLDELPQFFNVLFGDMTFVGPRPLLMEYNDLYSPEHALRLTVKPGITGLTQVSGRSKLTWKQRCDTDVVYVKNASFWLDQKIIFRTIFNVLAAKDSLALQNTAEDVDDLGLLKRSAEKRKQKKG